MLLPRLFVFLVALFLSVFLCPCRSTRCHVTLATYTNFCRVLLCVLRQVPIFEKKLFSMCTKEVEEELKKLPDRKDAVLFGIEAHVCVTQV